MAICCPICGKELSFATNEEDCPNSPYSHGKHPIVVLQATAGEWADLLITSLPAAPASSSQ